MKPKGKPDSVVNVPFNDWEARRLAFAVLAYLDAWEIARAVRSLIKIPTARVRYNSNRVPSGFEQECDALINRDKVQNDAIDLAEGLGIIFVDEMDKVVASEHTHGADVSRQGVQRDLLPIVEGTMVQTRYGFVNTDHILFIAAGAFHRAKPSDLMPELQGRFPIRVELKDLDKDDFVGRDALLAQKEKGLERKFCGFVLKRRGFPRPGYEIRCGGAAVGVVRSGTFGPTVEQGIGTGYLPLDLAKPGTDIEIVIRDRPSAAEVVKMPFYKEGSVKR